MCGLIGAVVTADSNVARRVRTGLSTLSHRGPDHQETQSFTLGGREVCLGHARLSIIDLHDEANQPMSSEDGRFVLIFNGEIYNYIELRDELRATGAIFRTRSDTEVLLKAWARWGETCLEKFDGMFAFALLDRSAGTLTCARDPFGIKPLFYASTDQGFYFASELPAMLDLLPNAAEADLQMAYDYLAHGDYDSSERTFIAGVKHLPPAHVMTVDVGTGAVRSLRRWWEPPMEQTSDLSFEDAAEAVREQFLLNIKRQLRSDVPLGAALSGGIDSSAVACAIRYLEPNLPIHTFSFIASDNAISEERWIDLVNAHIGAIPHKVHASAADLARDIDDLVRAQGEPFGSTSIYAQYRVFKLARESGITVTLDGQGADELLAGYSGYPGYRLLSYLSQGQVVRAWKFAHAWHRWPGRSYKLPAYEMARELAPNWAYARVRALAGGDRVPAWLDARQLQKAGVTMCAPRQRLGQGPRGRSVIAQLCGSLQGRGLPGLLRHGDRNSMRFSIESRVPFLSSDLCKLLYSLPENYLISENGETKSIFRAAMRGIVPSAILDRKDKIGFATPERQWFQQLGSIYKSWVKDAAKLPIFKAEPALQSVTNLIEGQGEFTWTAWRLINYIRWYIMNQGKLVVKTNTVP